MPLRYRQQVSPHIPSMVPFASFWTRSKKTKTVLLRLQERLEMLSPKVRTIFPWSSHCDGRAELKLFEVGHPLKANQPKKYPSAYARGRLESLREQILSLAAL